MITHYYIIMTNVSALLFEKQDCMNLKGSSENKKNNSNICAMCSVMLRTCGCWWDGSELIIM